MAGLLALHLLKPSHPGRRCRPEKWRLGVQQIRLVSRSEDHSCGDSFRIARNSLL